MYCAPCWHLNDNIFAQPAPLHAHASGMVCATVIAGHASCPPPEESLGPCRYHLPLPFRCLLPSIPLYPLYLSPGPVWADPEEVFVYVGGSFQ